MLKEFKEFALKGNAIELAVGVVVGTAFQAIVKSLVNDVIMPLISVLFGNVDFSDWVLKIGNNSNVDNFSSGGMYTFVDEEGGVYVPAIDKEGNIYDYHPQTNTKIVGFKVKNYDKIKEFVKELALVTPEVRYVGWDIAVSEKGPVLIEGNDYSGIFQVKPSISNIKTGDLPNYKKYMNL